MANATGTLTDGTYRIRTVSWPDYCVEGDVERNGAKWVGWWKVNNTDGEYVHLQTLEDGTYRIWFMLTQKCMASDGTWPTQTTDTSLATTSWTIAEASSGKYTIAASDGKYLTCDTGNWPHMSATATQYTFETVGVVSDGIYRIRSAKWMVSCIGIEGGSAANRAWAQLQGVHDTQNSQLWKVTHGDDGGLLLTNVNSGYCLSSVNVAAAKASAWVAQLKLSSSPDRWTGYIGEWGKVNGISNPYVTLRPSSGEGASLYLGVKTGWMQIQAQGKKYTGEWYNQLWYFDPSEAYVSSLTAPSGHVAFHGSYRDGEEPDDNMFFVGGTDATRTEEFTPAWIGIGSTWKVRYRTRKRAVSGSKWTLWSKWRSLRDGSASNGGWGDAWRSNCATETVGGYERADNPISVTLDGTYDREEIQLQVRRYEDSMPVGALDGVPARGNDATFTYAALWKPTVAVKGATMTRKGLVVSVASDYKHGGNTASDVTITGADGRTIVSGIRATNLPYNGELIVKRSQLASFPLKGETLTVSGVYSTTDTTVTLSGTAEMAYDGNWADVVPTVTESEGYSYLVSFQKATATECYIDAGDGTGLKVVPMSKKSNGSLVTYMVFPSFGSESTVWCYRDLGGTRWALGSAKITYDKTLNVYVWNYEGGWCQLIANKGNIPKLSRSTDLDYDSYATTAGRYKVIKVGNTVDSSLSVDGVCGIEGKDADHNSVDDVIALGYSAVNGNWCYFRTPDGHIYNVVVTKVSSPREGHGYYGMSVSMEEVDFA